MNYRKQKINFYQKRTLGENITATFDFLKDNWKPIVKLCLYVLLPLSIVQGVFMNNFTSAAVDAAMYPPTTAAALQGYSPTIVINYILLALFYMVGHSLLAAIVYTVMQKYQNSETSEKYPLADIKDDFISFMKQCFILMVYVMFISIGYLAIVGSLAYLFPYLLILIIPGTVALIIPLTLISPAYILGEGSGTNNALKESFRLGFPTWGSLFLLILVLGIVSSIIKTVTLLPWYLVFFVSKIMSQVSGGVTTSNSVWVEFITYIFAALQAFGAYLAGIFIFVGAAFHYFSALEAKDSVSVNDDIDNFEQL